MPKTLSEAEVSEFRARLCETAARMFVERGPEAVTMRTLAKELGCSAMTPYRYFKDKQAILAAVRAKGFEDLAEALEGVRRISGDAAANAAALGNTYFGFAFARPHVYRMMFDVSGPGEDRDIPAFVSAQARVYAALLAAIERIAGVVKGEEVLARETVMSALHGAAMLKLSGLLDKSVCPETLGSRLVLAMVGSLAADKKAGRKP